MIKGNAKQETKFENQLFTGFTVLTVKAVNPTRVQLNKLLEKEDSDDDKEIEYKGEDKDGNDRIRLVFWLHDENLNKFFPYSFNLIKKERMNKNEDKNQFINSVCLTSWADKQENLQDWFVKFIDRQKNELGTKEVRKALVGEEELGTLLRAWLGKLNWNDPETNVMIDTAKIFKEDYSELQSQIGGDYATPFVALLGVRTDENDTEKQYQQVYGKSFLPAGFFSYIENGFKFKTEYSKKVWQKFEEEVMSEYGFSSFYEMEPLKNYDKTLDPAVRGVAKDSVPVTPQNSKF